MNEISHARLERQTLTDGSHVFNVVLWDVDASGSHVRLSFIDKDGADAFLEVLGSKGLAEVVPGCIESEH